MIEVIEYKCKFCGANRAFECDMPEATVPRFNLDKMRPLLVCNTCADHEESRRRHERAIMACANWLAKWRAEIGGRLERSYSQNRTSELNEQLRSIEVRSEEILTTLTKRFAYCVCTFKRIAMIWEPEFVELIMKTPSNCGKHLSFYRNNVATK